MRDVLPWMIAHISCIMAHFALMAASTFAFVDPPGSSMSLSWDKEKWESDRQMTNLSWMTSAVAAFTMFGNGTYLMMLWTLEQRTAESTGDSRRFIKQMLLALGTAANCCFMFADFAFVKATGSFAAEYTVFGVIRAFAAIAGVTIIATVILDLVKIYDLWRQNRETYEVLNSMEPDDWEI